jgi:ubiquinone/menaquinone biosynthesis C-methylase UbiE
MRNSPQVRPVALYDETNNETCLMTDAQLNTVRDFEHAGWQAIASQYESLFAGATKHYVDSLLKITGTSSGTRLLDVACGPGFAAAKAKEMGAVPVGVDFSSAMIAVAKSKHAAIDFIVADATALPFEGSSFDAIIANFGVHHFENPGHALKEFVRVLGPAGRLAFTIWADPQENPAWRLIVDAVNAHGTFDVPMPAGNDKRNSIEDFIELTQGAGFSGVRAEQLERPWRMPAGTDLVSLFENSTVRMAFLLKGQNLKALSVIRQHVARAIKARLSDGQIRLSTNAYVVIASKD